MSLLDLINLSSIDSTHISVIVCVISATGLFRVCAAYAYNKKITEITIENLRFTKFFQKAAVLFTILALTIFNLVL